jgi:hypothetical protein
LGVGESVGNAKSRSSEIHAARRHSRSPLGDWGDGGDGSGKNMLGRILMEVREELRLEEATKEESEGKE